MLLEQDIASFIAAAEEHVGIGLSDLAKSLIKASVFIACNHAGRDLGPEQIVMAIREYRFDEAAITAAECGADAIGASIRSEETDHWSGDHDFLIKRLRAMLANGRSAGIGLAGLRDMATIFILIGYAIRVSRGNTAS